MNYVLSMASGTLTVILIIVVLQYALAMACIFRLFRYKPRLFGLAVWNFLIIAVIFIGPVLYLITNLGHKEPGVFMDKLLKSAQKPEDDGELKDTDDDGAGVEKSFQSDIVDKNSKIDND